MPRKARLDAPGTLHHVIIRGINKRSIVKNNADCAKFVERLGDISNATKTHIYAWALMRNHAHILLRSSESGLSHFMRRLLTGYAIYFNRKHRRWGHLFQNRYKSIICEEDAYFKELVRYIHLNPVRAKIVTSLSRLERYPWCGHSIILGKVESEWQDRDYVLKWFGKREDVAKKAYRKFISDGISQGRRPDLVGGGLIRSLGGWSAVKAQRRSGDNELSDDRILGSGKFVERVIREAEEKIKYQLPVNEQTGQIVEYITKICKKEKISALELKAGSRRKQVSEVRARIAVKLVKNYGVSYAEAARQLGISTSGIARILERSGR
jgi:REP element-mobilizing transposase RayT